MMPMLALLVLAPVAALCAAAGHPPSPISEVWAWLNAAFAAFTGTEASAIAAQRQLALAVPIVAAMLIGVIAIGFAGLNWSNKSSPTPARPAKPWNLPRSIAMRTGRALTIAATLIADWIRHEFGLDRLPPEVHAWPWPARLLVVALVGSVTLFLALAVHVACFALSHFF